MNRPEITQQVKDKLMSITGIRPGRKGTCECPICKDAILHWEVSAFNGAIKAFCSNSFPCVSWDEGEHG